MPSLNKVMLIGHIGKTPEFKATASGTSVCNFSIATSESYKGEKKTEWHRIVCFGRSAEYARDYLDVGQAVYVEGKIQTRSWEDKEGNTRYTTELIAFEVKGLGSKGETKTKADSETSYADNQPPAFEEDDDLPF